MLLLEQPADVNKGGHAVGALSWRDRWKGCKTDLKAFKSISPLLLMGSLLFLEMGAFQLWLQDELFSPKGVLWLLLMAASPFIAVLVSLLVLGIVYFLLSLLPFQGKQAAMRTLRLDKDGIKLSQTKYDRVPWQQVRRWFLTPVPDRQDLVTLTLERGNDKKSIRHYWSIVLDDCNQRKAFLTELGHLQQMGLSQAPVLQLSEPMPERKLALAGSWLMVPGIFLIFQGWPLLMFGVMPYHPHGTDRSPSHLTQVEENKMERVLRRVVHRFHISNEEQFRRVFWIPGALLITTGGGLYILGMLQTRRQLTELNQLYDLELAKITRPPIGSNPPS